MMRMGRAGTRGGEGAGPLERAALRWGKTMAASGRIGNRADVRGVRGRTVDAGGERYARRRALRLPGKEWKSRFVCGRPADCLSSAVRR